MNATRMRNDVPAVERLEDRLLLSAGAPVALSGAENEGRFRVAVEADATSGECTDAQHKVAAADAAALVRGAGLYDSPGDDTFVAPRATADALAVGVPGEDFAPAAEGYGKNGGGPAAPYDSPGDDTFAARLARVAPAAAAADPLAPYTFDVKLGDADALDGFGAAAGLEAATQTVETRPSAAGHGIFAPGGWGYRAGNGQAGMSAGLYDSPGDDTFRPRIAQVDVLGDAPTLL